MSILTSDSLKTYFENGDMPNGSDYSNLIDSLMGKRELLDAGGTQHALCLVYMGTTAPSTNTTLISNLSKIGVGIEQVLWYEAQPPVNLTTQPPVVTTQAPGVTTQAPVVTTQAPSVTTQAPSVTTQAPVVTTQPPVGSRLLDFTGNSLVDNLGGTWTIANEQNPGGGSGGYLQVINNSLTFNLDVEGYGGTLSSPSITIPVGGKQLSFNYDSAGCDNITVRFNGTETGFAPSSNPSVFTWTIPEGTGNFEMYVSNSVPQGGTFIVDNVLIVA